MTTITFKFYCQNLIIDTLNNMDPAAITTGYELGLLIEKEMKLPEYIDTQTMNLWATEMDQYYRYAVEEFGTVSNPFNNRRGFFKECTGFNVRVLISMSNTVRSLLDDQFKVADYKDQIIKDVLEVQEVVLQEVF